MAVGCNVEAAEKAYRLAEESFLANDIAGALRSARKAQMLFRSLPGLANAIAAYEVHAAAATSRASGRNWYAVLGVGGRSLTSGGVVRDAIKQRYRRLCLVLHPDKNRSVAADSAFKLLQQAWETLSVRHPPPPAAARADATPGAFSPSGAQPRPAYKAGPQASDDYRRPPPAYAYAPKDEKPRAKPPGTEANPPPPSPPRRKAALGSKKRTFPCPVLCPQCGTQYKSMVSVGMCHLTCQACNKYAMVHVRSDYLAHHLN